MRPRVLLHFGNVLTKHAQQIILILIWCEITTRAAKIYIGMVLRDYKTLQPCIGQIVLLKSNYFDVLGCTSKIFEIGRTI